MVIYLLKTYATEDLIAEADEATNQILQSDRKCPPKYSQELWSKALKSGTVYDEARLKGIFTEGIRELIIQIVRNYWGKNQKPAFRSCRVMRNQWNTYEEISLRPFPLIDLQKEEAAVVVRW